jgi:hypothetical protein
MKITEKDFNRLWDSAMAWGQDWKVQSERFDADVSFNWEQAYWFDSYSGLLLAKMFLVDENIPYQITADESLGWVLLTDHKYDGEQQ